MPGKGPEGALAKQKRSRVRPGKNERRIAREERPDKVPAPALEMPSVLVPPNRNVGRAPQPSLTTPRLPTHELHSTLNANAPVEESGDVGVEAFLHLINAKLTAELAQTRQI